MAHHKHVVPVHVAAHHAAHLRPEHALHLGVAADIVVRFLFSEPSHLGLFVGAFALLALATVLVTVTLNRRS